MLQFPKLYDFIPKLHRKHTGDLPKHKDKIILYDFYRDDFLYNLDNIKNTALPSKILLSGIWYSIMILDI